MIDPATITDRFASVPAVLQDRYKREPNELALVLIGDDDAETSLTVSQLWDHACRWNSCFRQVPAGGLAVLALGHSVDLIGAFWGALCAGLVPSVFSYLDAARDREVALNQLELLLTNADAAAAVVPQTADLDFGGIGLTPAAAAGHEDTVSDRGQEDLAYVQFTSGTTGMKKGVALSHRAVLNFVRVYADALDITPADRIANWPPLYHDFGLFGGLVFPVCLGIPTILMSPQKWVRSPGRFLQAISRHRGTICWMPSFGLNHSVRAVRPSEMEGLDLSCLRYLPSAAEPVRFDCQQAFLERFAGCGLCEDVMTTGYGMAENTLAATVSPPGRRALVDWIDPVRLQQQREAVPTGPEQKRISIVSCGQPVVDAEIRIVDEAGQDLPDRRVGEVLIRTPCLFSGYYRRPDLTAAVLSDGWFHTGDLGYMADGELYVCGRKKDLIIVGGNNIHPEDVEAVAMGLPGVRGDKVVAFGVPDDRLGTEAVVVVAELDRYGSEVDTMALEKELRRLVTTQMEITLGAVRFVPRGWVETTANRKLSRSRNRDKFLAERG